MDNIKSWSAEDEAIIATNTDATECKRCAVELGYWKDEYIGYFAKHADRKAPEINRGYYARVKGMEMFIHQFLERCGTKCQMINLGCGFDTLYWRMEDATRARVNFIELDFPTVTAKKWHIIKRNKRLLQRITSEDGEVAVGGGGGALHADGYHLVGCDLRQPAEVRRALAAAGACPAAPTLAIAECVLVYLRGDATRALLRLLTDTFPRLALLVYEQCNLADHFGEVMLRNLSLRGCGVAADASQCGSPEQQAQRMLELGFERAKAWDMDCVWRALNDEDRARAEALEMLDERELLLQLHKHYAITLATKGDLFADMDLYA